MRKRTKKLNRQILSPNQKCFQSSDREKALSTSVPFPESSHQIDDSEFEIVWKKILEEHGDLFKRLADK